MKRDENNAGARLISSTIVLLLLASLIPLFGSPTSDVGLTLDDKSNFFSSSSNESYDLYIDSPTSESGGDGSISTAEPEGSSEELSVLSTVEFYTNEMISDLQVYGEGANNYIELSMYVKFEGNDGATADITFKLVSGSNTIEQEVVELDDPCSGGGGFGGIGGGSCTYAVNVVNFEIAEGGFTVENGKKLGVEIVATIDGCQGGGIGGDSGNCDVMVQFGDIEN